MVDPAELAEYADASPAAAQSADCSSTSPLLPRHSADRPAADLPGLLGVRPDRRMARHRRSRELSDGGSADGLADGVRPRDRHGRLIVAVPLDRAAARASGPLFDLLGLLCPQVDGGARDRSDARDAVLAVRHDLHAQLVSPDGREDRQGRRNLHQPRRPLRSRRASARRTSSPTRWCSATRTSAAAGCTSTTSRRAPACSSATTRSCRRHRDSRGRAHRHQVEAAGQRADLARRHLVRLAADQAAGAPAVRRRRRQLDLRALVLAQAFARRLRGGAHLVADDAVHHLRHGARRSSSSAIRC